MQSQTDVEKRRKIILDRLIERGVVVVEELRAEFKVSAVTIRKDLMFLEEKGIIRRTHGGAEMVKSQDAGKIAYEPSFKVRKKQHPAEKSAIGQYAASLVQSGDSIALDSSSTTAALIPFLKKINALTVYTNSLYVALGLADNVNINIIMPGGRFRRDSQALIGKLEELNINLNWGFFGARGVNAQIGITDVHQEEAAFKQQLVKRCLKPIILVDSSKWGVVAPYTFAQANELHGIVTTLRVSDEVIQPFLERDVRVHRAPLPLE